MQYLVILALIVGVYFFFIRERGTKPASPKKDKTQETSNEMVACSACGIYCEVDEALLSSAKYYCSKECVRRG